MLKPKNRIVLIGGTGMIGSALQFELEKNNLSFVLVGRDVSDYKFLKSKINKNDIVYYLASENRLKNWSDFYNVNVVGVKNLVKICKNIKVAKLIYVSTTMVFENGKIRQRKTGNYYIDSKVIGVKYFLNNLQDNFYIVYPGVVLYLDFRYKKTVVTVVDKVKIYFGLFTQGGLMMMVGNKKRKFKYIFINDLVKILLNLTKSRQVIAVSGEMTVESYVKTASLTTRFWPFRIAGYFLKVLNLFLRNKIVLE